MKYTEAQTVAVQRLVPIAPLPGMSVDTWTDMMTKALQVMRRIPGLR